MERKEVVEIVEKEIAAGVNQESISEAKRKVFLAVAEKRVKTSLSEESWRILGMTFEFDKRLDCLRHYIDGLGEGQALGPRQFVNIMFLYEKAANLCKFLLANYDEAPESLRSAFTRDQLIDLEVCLRARSDYIFQESATIVLFDFDTRHTDVFGGIAARVRQFLLGDEESRRLAEECNDALVILRSLAVRRRFVGNN